MIEKSAFSYLYILNALIGIDVVLVREIVALPNLVLKVRPFQSLLERQGNT